jgi:quinol monooxygenase YgiN
MDNSNHFVLIEKWESKDDQFAYLKFREEEGPEGALAQLMPLLDGEPKFIYWNIDSVY